MPQVDYPKMSHLCCSKMFMLITPIWPNFISLKCSMPITYAHGLMLITQKCHILFTTKFPMLVTPKHPMLIIKNASCSLYILYYIYCFKIFHDQYSKLCYAHHSKLFHAHYSKMCDGDISKKSHAHYIKT